MKCNKQLKYSNYVAFSHFHGTAVNNSGLLNHGRTSAQKLAQEFEVSSRTIMRDLESLDQAGIPIQSFYGVEGGYQIMDSFVLDKQAATSHEYDWIVTAREFDTSF